MSAGAGPEFGAQPIKTFRFDWDKKEIWVDCPSCAKGGCKNCRGSYSIEEMQFLDGVEEGWTARCVCAAAAHNRSIIGIPQLRLGGK
jgi:hypothetical protein